MEWEKLSNDDLEQGISHFLGLVSAGLAKTCEWLVEVDRRQQWLGDGSPDLNQWLSARFGLSHDTARRLTRTARRLQDLPRLQERFSCGELSLDQVEAIARMASAETEELPIDEAAGLTVAGLERAARRARPPSRDSELSAHADRYCHIQRSLDGVRAKMHTALPGAEMDVLEAALQERADSIPPNPDTGLFDPYPQRLADGLVELAATSSSGEHAPAQVSIAVDLEALTSESGGASESELGCGRTRWVHGHHMIHWSQGGRTDLDNLILLCGFHHRFLHEHGWTIVASHDRYEFRKPDGRAFPPPRPSLHPRLRALVEVRTWGRPPPHPPSLLST